MESDLLSSREAAAILGVSPSSVKRWADEGLLRCIKTAGRHRRFPRADVEQFRGARSTAPEVGTVGDAELWLHAMLGAGSPHALEARLLSARAELGTWWRVADRLGPALEALGDAWADGRLTILQEHLASERLARGLARAGEWIPVPAEGPPALLLTAEGDDHTLGLALAELCLRELGWSTLWAGRRTPSSEVSRALAEASPPIRMLALSASSSSTDAGELADQVAVLGAACRAHGTTLVLGGTGAWPERPAYGVRLVDFRGLNELARGLGT